MKAATITIDGKAIGFVARKAPHTGDDACKGCLFDSERSTACNAVWHAATDAAQPRCEDRAPNGGTFIYVEADPRQLVLDEDDQP
ncbi:hypothetical protein INH39_25485 [Massilia violaceinigra]|uniref:Uncharacterized protein n=1 Tax=Massilia violaceinigra TaxID=2045208 RepID=A0ABY4A3Z5_9BURK|nr:hypothetical protein [Massilia violaceinigra]UOD28764.1 hypothetical protein INH39_25485 [Massilia violaceinigra]